MANKMLFADEAATISGAFTHTGPIGFYGAVPVGVRTGVASFHSTSWVSVSSNITVGSALAAWVTEVTQTLVALGIWT